MPYIMRAWFCRQVVGMPRWIAVEWWKVRLEGSDKQGRNQWEGWLRKSGRRRRQQHHMIHTSGDTGNYVVKRHPSGFWGQAVDFLFWAISSDFLPKEETLHRHVRFPFPHAGEKEKEKEDCFKEDVKPSIAVTSSIDQTQRKKDWPPSQNAIKGILCKAPYPIRFPLSSRKYHP